MDKDIIIKINIKETGQIVIDTEEEYIPTEVAQKILNEVLTKYTKLNNYYLIKERKRWMFIAFAMIALSLLLLLKLKGVI